jgi:hypothetical protein
LAATAFELIPEGIADFGEGRIVGHSAARGYKSPP